MRELAELELLVEFGRLAPLRREMAACAAPELNPGAAAVLWHLSEQEPQRLTQVAADLHIALSGVSRAVSDLVAASCVVREADPADHRA